MPHRPVCSSRKMESTHRWNLLASCHFSTLISSSVFTYRLDEREHPAQLKSLHRGHSQCLPAMTELSHHSFYAAASRSGFLQMHSGGKWWLQPCVCKVKYLTAVPGVSHDWATFWVLQKKTLWLEECGCVRFFCLIANPPLKLMSKHSWLIIFSARCRLSLLLCGVKNKIPDFSPPHSHSFSSQTSLLPCQWMLCCTVFLIVTVEIQFCF